MLVRFQQLLARCSRQQFPAVVNLSRIAYAKSAPISSAVCFSYSSSIANRFSSLSNARKTPPSSQHTELEPGTSEKKTDESAQFVPADQLPNPSPSHHQNSADAADSPTNLIMRTSLVGASVGLLTPLYVAAGVGWIWQMYKPASVVGKAAKFAVGGLFLGGAYFSGWTFFTQHVLPFTFNHAEIVLPFALANAAVASLWYAIGESVFGLQRMSGHTTIFSPFRKLFPASSASIVQAGLPLGGPLVGLLTALTCFPLWQPLSQRFWPQELLNACDTSVLANAYLSFLPVGLGTGALVGLGLHFALSPVFTGRIPNFGGVAVAPTLLLVVLALTLGYFYFCRFDYEAWEQRMHADGEMYWARTATGQKEVSSERLLNDTWWFLNAVAMICNLNSFSNRSHFCFVNKHLLADALVADFKNSSIAHGKSGAGTEVTMLGSKWTVKGDPSTSGAFEVSKLLLHHYYGIDLKDLKDLIVQLLRNQHDLRMALSVTDGGLKADLAKTIQECTRLQEDLVVKIRALGQNVKSGSSSHAAVAIDYLLSDLPTLESRLITETGQDFSKGTGAVTMFLALHSFIGGMTLKSNQGLSFSSKLLLGGLAGGFLTVVVCFIKFLRWLWR
jgi:hypothetical protein